MANCNCAEPAERGEDEEIKKCPDIKAAIVASPTRTHDGKGS